MFQITDHGLFEKEIMTLNWSLSYRVLQICTPGTELYTRMYPYFGHCRNMYPASVRMYPAFSSIGSSFSSESTFKEAYVLFTFRLSVYKLIFDNNACENRNSSMSFPPAFIRCPVISSSSLEEYFLN